MSRSSSIDQLISKAARLSQAQKYDKAKGLYKKVLKTVPNHFDAYFQLSLIAAHEKRFDQAIDYTKSAVRHANNATQKSMACDNLGTIYFNLGALDQAIEIYNQNIEENPQFAESIFNLGQCYRTKGNLTDALTCYIAVINLNPNYVSAYIFLGSIYISQRKYALAINALQAAHKLQPSNSGILVELGNLYRTTGELERAKSVFLQALSQDPTMVIARYNLMTLNHQPDNNDISAMESQLMAPSTSPINRIYLGFTLAHAYDLRQEYNKSFLHLRDANLQKRKSIDYDITAEENYINETIATFNQAYVDTMAVNQQRQDAPIFIVGMPRSGSSLIEQIIASHSSIQGGGELYSLGNIVSNLNQTDNPTLRYPNSLAKLTASDLSRLADSYIDSVKETLKPGRFTDKMPHNFLFIAFIFQLFPNAKVIHSQRDPIDTCFACYRTLFSQGQNFSYSLEELGRYHQLYCRLMNHWHQMFPGKILDVSYEAVVQDQAGETQRILDYCNLEMETDCLTFYKSKRSVATASAMQVRQPIYTHAIQRWRHYEKQLQPLLEILSTSQ